MLLNAAKVSKAAELLRKKIQQMGWGWGEGLKITPFPPLRLGLRRNLKKDRK